MAVVFNIYLEVQPGLWSTYLQRLRAPVADLPTYLRVPFAEYPEIILDNDQKQQLIETMALDRLESSKWPGQGLTMQKLDSPQEELFIWSMCPCPKLGGSFQTRCSKPERNGGDRLVFLANTNSDASVFW